MINSYFEHELLHIDKAFTEIEFKIQVIQWQHSEEQGAPPGSLQVQSLQSNNLQEITIKISLHFKKKKKLHKIKERQLIWEIQNYGQKVIILWLGN